MWRARELPEFISHLKYIVCASRSCVGDSFGDKDENDLGVCPQLKLLAGLGYGWR